MNFSLENSPVVSPDTRYTQKKHAILEAAEEYYQQWKEAEQRPPLSEKAMLKLHKTHNTAKFTNAFKEKKLARLKSLHDQLLQMLSPRIAPAASSGSLAPFEYLESLSSQLSSCRTATEEQVQEMQELLLFW